MSLQGLSNSPSAPRLTRLGTRHVTLAVARGGGRLALRRGWASALRVLLRCLSAGRRVPGRGRHPVQCAAGWFRLQGEKQDASQPRSPKILSSAASKGSTCGHLRRLAPAQAPQVPFALLGLAPTRASPHARRSPPAGGHATVTPALEGGRSLWPTSHEWKRQKPWCGPSRAAEGPWLGARSPCLVLLP